LCSALISVPHIREVYATNSAFVAAALTAIHTHASNVALCCAVFNYLRIQMQVSSAIDSLIKWDGGTKLLLDRMYYHRLEAKVCVAAFDTFSCILLVAGCLRQFLQSSGLKFLFEIAKLYRKNADVVHLCLNALVSVCRGWEISVQSLVDNVALLESLLHMSLTEQVLRDSHLIQSRLYVMAHLILSSSSTHKVRCPAIGIFDAFKANPSFLLRIINFLLSPPSPQVLTDSFVCEFTAAAPLVLRTHNLHTKLVEEVFLFCTDVCRRPSSAQILGQDESLGCIKTAFVSHSLSADVVRRCTSMLWCLCGDAQIAERATTRGLISSCVDSLQRNISDVIVVRNVAGVAGNVALHSSELRRYLLKENVPKTITLCIKSLEFNAEVTSACLNALANLCADVAIASTFVAEEGMAFITSVMAVHPTVVDVQEAAFRCIEVLCRTEENPLLWSG
jgi:hypothetical protein